MAGVYVHIPFCASRCLYCDFFSTTALERRKEYVDALLKEMELRKGDKTDYGTGEVETIYIGGGTPSQLRAEELGRIFDAVYANFRVSENAEVTIECNPEDVDKCFLDGLRKLPVNRVSMGIKSFDDERLRFLCRRHNSEKAINSVHILQDEGYENISIDLMFGFPGERITDWEQDLRTAVQLGIPHLSAYSLMYEEGTRLTKLRDAGKIIPIADEESLAMYTLLLTYSEKCGYEHYEISNFSKAGYTSRHNNCYWTGVPYIGFGAGAHSYDGKQLRRWNVSSLDSYMKGVNNGESYFENEMLSERDIYNEYIMTRLRTRIGIDLGEFECIYGEDEANALFKEMMERHISLGNLTTCDGHLRLTRKGLFISDSVMSDFFVV